MFLCRRQQNVDETVAEMRAKGLTVSGMVCHVGNAQRRQALVDRTIQVTDPRLRGLKVGSDGFLSPGFTRRVLMAEPGSTGVCIATHSTNPTAATFSTCNACLQCGVCVLLAQQRKEQQPTA
jgi:hypothetical protein